MMQQKFLSPFPSRNLTRRSSRSPEHQRQLFTETDLYFTILWSDHQNRRHELFLSTSTESFWETREEQMTVIVNFYRSWSDSLSWDLIGPIFHLAKGAIQQHSARAISQRPEIEGRPSFLTAHEIEEMQVKIYQRFCIYEPMTYDQLLGEIEIEMGKFILSDALRKIIAGLPWCRTVQGIPKEATRVRCDEADVTAYFENLKPLITGEPASAV
jgi:hypothetical protein